MIVAGSQENEESLIVVGSKEIEEFGLRFLGFL
jgi:hypothetical protein